MFVRFLILSSLSFLFAFVYIFIYETSGYLIAATYVSQLYPFDFWALVVLIPEYYGYFNISSLFIICGLSAITNILLVIADKESRLIYVLIPIFGFIAFCYSEPSI